MRFTALPVHSFEDVTLDLEQLQALLTLPAWVAPGLINGWANVGAGTAVSGYHKDGVGYVHLKGRVAGGASGSIAFVLPAGFRPGTGQDFYPAGGYNGTTAVAAFAAIDAAGNVNIFFAAGATQVALGGISFRAEN